MWTEQQLAYMKVLGLKLWQPNTSDTQVVYDAVNASPSTGVAQTTVTQADTPQVSSESSGAAGSDASAEAVDIAAAANTLEQLLNEQVAVKTPATQANKSKAEEPSSQKVEPKESLPNQETVQENVQEKIALYTLSLNDVLVISETDWDAAAISQVEQRFLQGVMYSAVVQQDSSDESADTVSVKVDESLLKQLQMNHFRWPPSSNGLLAETPCSEAVETYINQMEFDSCVVFGAGLVSVLKQTSQEKLIMSDSSIAQIIQSAEQKKALWKLLQSRL